MTSAYKLLRALLVLLWPPSLVAASTVTIDATLTEISLLAWSIVCLLATMGGLTSLLHRLRTDTPDKMTLYVASHMMMAWFTGSGAFLLLESWGAPDLLELVLIAFASYSGARIVDRLSERFALWAEEKLEKLFG